LELFQKALRLRGAPPLYAQGKGKEDTVYVKIFDPCSSWSWFIMEFDGNDECFGYIKGIENEYGYISLTELANTPGRMRIGMEIDVWFKPTRLETVIAECKA
jgi:hypothetical protein